MGNFKDEMIRNLKESTNKIVNDTIDSVSKTIDETIKNKEFRENTKEKIKMGVTKTVTATKEVAVKTKDKSVEFATKTQQEMIKVMDKNGDGKLDIEDIIILALSSPGVAIDRANFLRKEFTKKYDQKIIEKAILETPAKAGITKEDIDKIANDVINYERNCVTGISTALGMPGGAVAIATASADIAQYYGYMLRAIQKLLYLYGFPEMDVKQKGQIFDTETLNMITLCLGVMYGVAGAKNGIVIAAKALGSGVERKLVNAALTKGIIYPIVKKVAKWFGVNMTKEIFAGFFKHAIPIAGGLIGGTITYVSFKPCCDKLKDSLKDTLLSNPEIFSGQIDKEVQEIIEEIEYKVIDEDTIEE